MCALFSVLAVVLGGKCVSFVCLWGVVWSQELTREVLVGNYLTEGEYHMVLIVGDPSFGNVISWDLGTLQLGLGSVVDDVPAPPSPPKVAALFLASHPHS